MREREPGRGWHGGRQLWDRQGAHGNSVCSGPHVGGREELGLALSAGVMRKGSMTSCLRPLTAGLSVSLELSNKAHLYVKGRRKILESPGKCLRAGVEE